jgi:hypothetical protein
MPAFNQLNQTQHHQNQNHPPQFSLTITYLIPFLCSIPVFTWLIICIYFPSLRQHILDFQRNFITRCLTASGVEHSFEFADQNWYDKHGSFLSILGFILITVGNIISWIIEGKSNTIIRYAMPMMLLLIPIYFFYVREITRSFQLRKLQIASYMVNSMTVFLSGILHAQILKNENDPMTLDMVKRHLFSSAFICLFMFESLADCLIAMFGSTCSAGIAYYMRGHDIWQVIYHSSLMCGLIILITFTSVRGRMNAIFNTLFFQPQYRDSTIKFYITAISTMFLYGSMYATTIEPVHFSIMFKDLALSFHVVVMYLVWKGSPFVDIPITSYHVL